ncbi:AMP-binding protein [Candidatus Uabimicrobium sp. HlEnr_7]|uniref:AMP-binding protein n=1 Tax=Candidatus Uabimicrobium helgolandensis TaxID=3095367 RepID=UPI003557DFBE
MKMKAKSLAEKVFNNETFQPSKTALIYQENPKDINRRKELAITYGELEMGSARCASFLKKIGFQKGDRAIVFVSLSAELYEIIFAISRLGGVLVFLDAWTGIEQFDQVCQLSQPKVFFGTTKAHSLRLMSRACSKIPHKVIVGKKYFPGYSYKKEMAKSKPFLEFVELQNDDAEMIAFTTGSSGVPKGCVRTPEVFQATCNAIETIEDTHMLAWPGVILGSLLWGKKVIVPAFEQGKIRECDHEYTLDLINKHKVELIVAPPIFYEGLLGSLKGSSCTKSIKKIYSGGAPISDNTLRMLTEKFPHSDVSVIYGSTECEPICLLEKEQYLNKKNIKNYGFCVGPVHESLQCKVLPTSYNKMHVEDLGNDLPIGEIGEIVVAGPQVTSSYWNNEKAFSTNKIQDKGFVWHRLGDIGFFDEQKNLWLVGRHHNIVRKENHFLYPAAVEPIFEKIPGVTRAGLTSYESEGKTKATIVLECSPDEDYEKCIQKAEECKQQTQIDQVLVKYQLPKDPRHNTKIDARKLKQSVVWHNKMKREGSLISTTALTSKDSFVKRFVAYLNERFDPKEYLVMITMMVIAFAQVFRFAFEIPLTTTLAVSVLATITMKFCFYLLMRVFDEHKDWEDDHVAFPERILSLNIITLHHLKLVGLVCLFIIYGVSAFLGKNTLIVTTVVVIYALLMLKEFFVKEWLKKHLFWYGVSHNLIVFLTIHWCFTIFAEVIQIESYWTNTSLSIFAIAINFLLFSLEVARKIRLPEFERKEVDTYSKVIGHSNAAFLALTLQAVGLALIYSSLTFLSVWHWSAILATYTLLFVIVVRFVQKPTEKVAEKLMKPCSLVMMVVLIAIICNG